MAEFPNLPQTPVRDARKPSVVDDAVRVLALQSRSGALGTIVNFGIHVELAWIRIFSNFRRRRLFAGRHFQRHSRRWIFKEGIGGTTLWLTGNIGGLMTSGPGEWVEDPFSESGSPRPGTAAKAFGHGLARSLTNGTTSASSKKPSPTLKFARKGRVRHHQLDAGPCDHYRRGRL